MVFVSYEKSLIFKFFSNGSSFNFDFTTIWNREFGLDSILEKNNLGFNVNFGN
jgi:hypothetical protein